MKSLLILGSVATVISFAPAAAAKPPSEIEQITKSVSVEIQVPGTDRVGSGVMMHRQGNQGAAAAFNKAISLNPKDADAYINRGNLKYEKLNDPQGALADYDQAIALAPKYALAYHNRGILKKNKLNDPKGALADYD
jgi:tetratricopeptide (TPR) repeat protein